MEINSSRAQAIQAWIKDHPEEESNFEKARVQLEGRTVTSPVWRVPIKLLVYNIRNGRFAAELISKERELKRSLDPTSEEDEKIVRQLLLDQKPDETEALKDDLRKHGQLEYGIITFDGAVINANRRMAILSTLATETHESKFEYLRVAILPKNVNPKDLWKIEAGLQFGKDFLLSYGPVNELLKIREGEKQGLTADEISTTLLGRFSTKDIENKMKILDQIESYLDFIGKPKQYEELEQDVEKFNSLQNNVISSLVVKDFSKKEILDINLIAFSLIKHKASKTKSKIDGITHWDIRKLKDIVQDEDARQELRSKYNFDEPIKTNLSELIDSFKNAEEIVENKKSQNRPIKLLKRAFEAIRVVSGKSPKLKTEEASFLLNQIGKEVIRLKKKGHN